MTTKNTPARDQAPIQSAELAELKRLAEAATPGPWETHVITDDECCRVGLSIHADGERRPISDDDHAPLEKDARFIAAANPATILRLLDALAAVPAAQQQAQSCDKLTECRHCGFYVALNRAPAAAPPPAATPARELTDADKVAALLTMTLRADSGFQSKETHRISATQWGRILTICNERPATPQGESDEQKREA